MRWDWECGRCGLRVEMAFLTFEEASEDYYCVRCDRDETLCGERVIMQRLVPGANFVVKGWNAKNGYSGKGEK